MNIFKYNLKKYLRTPSTWIILFLTSLIMIAVTIFCIKEQALNINAYFDSNNNIWWMHYSVSAILNSFKMNNVILIVATIFFTIFKSVQLLSDEINEGSLLLVISKPISRKKILIYKWLSLISIFLFFILIILLTQLIVLLSFLKYDYNVYNLFFQSLISEFFLALLFFLLSSSLALLLSLRFSFKTIISISFAFTLLIGVSNSIQSATYKPQFKILKSRKIETNSDAASMMWNTDKNDWQKIPIPHVAMKKTNHKPLFNKLWPLDLKYQINQMSHILISHNKLYEQSDKKLINFKSPHTIDFSKLSHTLFIDHNSDYMATRIIEYLNTDNYTDSQGKTTTISQYLKPGLIDANNFLTMSIKEYKYPAKVRDHFESVFRFKSIRYFGVFDHAKYSKSANLFFNVIKNKKIMNDIWDIANLKILNTYPGLFPVDPDGNTNLVNANTLFNLLLNYKMNTTNARLLLSKQIIGFSFADPNDITAIPRPQTELLFVYPVDHMTFSTYKVSNMRYFPWTTIYSYINGLIKNYNQNTLNKNNKLEFMDLTKNINTFNKYFYIVETKNYANPYMLITFYLVISIGLLPLTYWLFNRSDFN